jgi:hypothetical protein
MPLDPYLSAKLHLLEGVDMTALDAITQARVVEFAQDPAPWSMPPQPSRSVVTRSAWPRQQKAPSRRRPLGALWG